jgi:hypothetical protein
MITDFEDLNGGAEFGYGTDAFMRGNAGEFGAHYAFRYHYGHFRTSKGATKKQEGMICI